MTTRRTGEDVEMLVEAIEEFVDGQGRRPCGGEFDAEGQAIDGPGRQGQSNVRRRSAAEGAHTSSPSSARMNSAWSSVRSSGSVGTATLFS
jgi:hypothetical protein